MAKFTKLNIGDSVASGGGRVWRKLSAESAQEELLGTWVLNSSIDSSTNPTSNYDFDVNGVFNYPFSTSTYEAKTLSRIGLYANSGNAFLLANGSSIVEGLSQNIYLNNYSQSNGKYFTSRYVKSNKWVYSCDEKGLSFLTSATGIKVRTFTITSHNIDADAALVLLTWLEANATKTA